jgi:hypothetical protein
MVNCIIFLFNSKYKRRWINVIFLQNKHKIIQCKYRDRKELLLLRTHIIRWYEHCKIVNCIIFLFNSKYKRRWINVIFLQNKHKINTVSIYNLCVFGRNLVKSSANVAFIPVFRPHTCFICNCVVLLCFYLAAGSSRYSHNWYNCFLPSKIGVNKYFRNYVLLWWKINRQC